MVTAEVSKVKIYTDKPILSHSDDILGRSALAENIAKVVKNCCSFNITKNESFVIGIQGEWGSGKTSLLNMIEENIDGNETVLVKMNSWMTVDAIQLMQEFFRTFLSAINKAEKSIVTSAKHDWTIRRQKLISYFNAFLDSSSFSIGIGASGLKPSISVNLQKLRGSESLNIKKEDIVDILGQNDKTIVFFIDDIDRLNELEIGILFQLIKNIADFPKVVYILAYDVNIVSSALDKIHSGRGKSYIEKIVQYTLDVPLIEKDMLDDYFVNEIASILSKDGSLCEVRIELDKLSMDKCFQEIYYEGISFYLKSIRDCKRTLNGFSFEYNVLKENVFFADLLSLTVLKLYDLEVYKYIYSHPKELFVQQTLSVDKGKMAQTTIEKICSLSVCKDEKYIKKIIYSLFPNLAKVVKGSSIALEDNISYCKHRLHCEDFFHIYFQMGILNGYVDDNLLRQMLSGDNVNDWQEIFVGAGRNAAFGSLCRHIMALLDDNQPNSIYVVWTTAIAIFKILSQKMDIKRKNIFDIPYFSKRCLIMAIMSNVLKQHGNNNDWCKKKIGDILLDDAIDEDVAICIIAECCRGTDWCASIGAGLDDETKQIEDDTTRQYLQRSYISRLNKLFQNMIFDNKMNHINDYGSMHLKLFAEKMKNELINGFIDKIPVEDTELYNFVTFYLRVNAELYGDYCLKIWPRNISYDDVRARLEIIERRYKNSESSKDIESVYKTFLWYNIKKGV